MKKKINCKLLNFLSIFKLRNEIKEKLGSELHDLKAIKYSTQVVRGVNYFIKVKIVFLKCFKKKDLF